MQRTTDPSVMKDNMQLHKYTQNKYHKNQISSDRSLQKRSETKHTELEYVEGLNQRKENKEIQYFLPPNL